MSYLIDLRKPKKIFCTILIIILFLFIAYKAFSWYYPLKYIETIKKHCIAYDLEPSLVCGLIHAESKFDHMAVSQKGASGLMQIVRDTGDWAADEIGIYNYSYDRIFEPEINIEIGCWYLNRMINQYGNLDTALAAYNAGSGNVSKWLDDKNFSKDGKTLDIIPFKETEDYIKRVEFNTRIYKLIIK